MRCKRHTLDNSSKIGVCASCLRERLFSLAASQNEVNNHHPLVFPRSVSPYVAPRKSDAAGGGGGGGSSLKKKLSGLSLFSSFFVTRSDGFDSSRSWLSKILSLRSKKERTATSSCYIEDLIASESDHRHRYCRGMSPAGDWESESVSGRKRRTPSMGTPGRRKTPMIGLSKSVSEMAFCLSPLVRAKPNGSFKLKGKFPPDFGYSGEMKLPANPHISTAASFSSNRSKKLVDLGRVDQRR